MADDGFNAALQSYPKAAPPITSPLEVAGQITDYQQKQANLSQSKLDQANQSLGYMTRAMGSLGPDASKKDYLKVGQNVVDMGLVPKEMLGTYVQRLQAAPTAKDFFNEFMTAAASHQQQIDYHLGRVGTSENGQTVTPTVISPKPGFGQKPIGVPVQQQAPPTSLGYDENGQPRTLGAQPPQLAPGTAAQPTPLPVARPAMPVQRPVMPNAASGPTGPTSQQQPAAGFPQPRGAAAGTAPNFEVGQKMYANDQTAATSKSTALKPLEEAYDLAKTVSTGPGTENLNKARAYLINAGVIKADQNNPAVIYAELNKNLAQFVDKNGSRSDADLAVKESGNANAKTQVQPALLHMVQKIISRERIEIARPQAFEGKDYQNYGSHSASFPTSQDERAYGVDKMDPAEARALYLDMKNKAVNGKPSEKREAIKFLKSYITARKTGQVKDLPEAGN